MQSKYTKEGVRRFREVCDPALLMCSDKELIQHMEAQGVAGSHKKMFATLFKNWKMLDGTDGKSEHVHIKAGRYEIEKIRCPVGYDCSWLVFKGTKIGMAEGAWRQWKNGEILDNPKHPNHGKPIEWGEFQIIIEEY